jgi:glutathione S-transferase
MLCNMIKIYGWRKSRAARCLWLLEELGVPYQHIPLNHLAGETRTPEYLVLNPAGKIPTLDHDGFVLTETVAINHYLASVFPGTLLPSGAQDLARLNQWTSWSITDVEPLLVNIMREGRRPAEQIDQERVNAWRTDLLSAIGTRLEAHLGRQAQILPGNAFTLADLNVASAVGALPMLGIELMTFPALDAWLKRCQSRPAWQRVQSLP